MLTSPLPFARLRFARRSPRRLSLGAGTALAAAALTLGPAVGQAATSLPRVPSDLFAPAHYLKIKPAYIGYTGDGTGILSGPGGVRTRIAWTSWTSQNAVGTGENRLDTCARSCAGGPFNVYPVRIEAWRPAVLHGQRVFTRLTIWYTGARRPARAPAHFTFTDVYQNHGWGFSPPSAEGYCTDTMGQPRDVGCANITTLP